MIRWGYADCGGGGKQHTYSQRLHRMPPPPACALAPGPLHPAAAGLAAGQAVPHTRGWRPGKTMLGVARQPPEGWVGGGTALDFGFGGFGVGSIVLDFVVLGSRPGAAGWGGGGVARKSSCDVAW